MPFAGTSAFGVEVLRGLLAAGVEVPLVLSQPDRPAGRKRVLTPPPVAVFAREAGIPLLQPEHALEALAPLGAVSPTAIAICAYGQILPLELLALCPWLNLHPSLLPRWRGAAPIERALLSGDTETGVAIMETVAALDAGPLVSVDRFVIDVEADAAVVEREALRLGIPALVRAIQASVDGTLASVEQSVDGITYAAKLERTDRLIDPQTHGQVVTANRVRALRPQIGALLAIDGEIFTIWGTAPSALALAPGTAVVTDEELHVGLADGALRITELQTAGKRALPAAEWLRGRRQPPRSVVWPA